MLSSSVVSSLYSARNYVKSFDNHMLKMLQISKLMSVPRRRLWCTTVSFCDSKKHSEDGETKRKELLDAKLPNYEKDENPYRKLYTNPISKTFGVMGDDVKEFFGNKRREVKRMLGTTSETTENDQKEEYCERETTKSVWTSYCDVVIIGGGAVGSSIAYHLKERALQGLDVVVVEQDFTYEKASTVLSVGGIRQQFSIVENIELSLYGMQFLRNAPEFLSVEGADVPDMQFNPGGYLTLASEAGVESLKDNYDIQRSVGAKVEFLTAKKLKSRYPWINTEGIEAGVIGLENEGWFDPWSFLCCLRRKAVNLGAHYVNGKVTGLRTNVLKDMYTGGVPTSALKNVNSLEVTLPDGEIREINASIVILAAGAWTGEIGRLAGIGNGTGVLKTPIPIEPRKRYVYCIHAPDGPGLDCPLVIDPTNTYFRREGLGGLYLCGKSPCEDEEPPIDNLDVDESYFESQVWPTIAQRVKGFENAKLKSSWAGYYDYNTFDQNGIIGLHPTINNLYIVAGFSGHGIQQAPGVGRAVMELIVHAEYRTINLEQFAFERVLMNDPLFERYIV